MSEFRLQGHVPANRFGLFAPMTGFNSQFAAGESSGSMGHPLLGFELSERTISRWMKRAPRGPDQAKRWLAFLRNHREAIAAMDFFTVPTITFGVLYWHAALPIMSTPCRSHRLGGARIVFRIGIIRGLPRSSVACHKGGILLD